MVTDTGSRPSVLAATLSILYCRHAFATLVTVDDRDSSLVWGGSWKPFSGQPEAEDGTLTWANNTGPTVTFTFTGVDVRVYGAFKPVGTWNIQSLYAVDGGSLTPFVPSRQVDQESFRQMFFDSGPLSLGEHTLKITNLGVQLWLDYFVYDDGGDGANTNTPSSPLVSTGHAGGVTTTATTRASSSSVAIITSSSPSSNTRDTSGGSIASADPAVPTSSLPMASLDISPRLTPSPASSVTPTLFQSSLLPLSSSSSSTAVPRESSTPQANTHGMSHAALVGLSVGAVIVGVALLVILLRRQRRHRRTEARLRASWNPLLHPGQDRASHSTTPSSDTLAVRGGSEVGYCSSSQWLQQAEEKRPMDSDGGASVVGGQRVEAAMDARSVEDATSGKSTPPPSYREFEDDVLLSVRS